MKLLHVDKHKSKINEYEEHEAEIYLLESGEQVLVDGKIMQYLVIQIYRVNMLQKVLTHKPPRFCIYCKHEYMYLN